jgi:hypothetical protein
MLAKLRRLLTWRCVDREHDERERHERTMQDADQRLEEAEARLRMLDWQTDVEGRREPRSDQS